MYDSPRRTGPDTPRRGNPNLSSGQFGAPTPRWNADGGVLAMPDHLKRDLDDVLWDERSKLINTPGRPYISEEDDEVYRANFGDDYYKDGNLGHSTKNWS